MHALAHHKIPRKGKKRRSNDECTETQRNLETDTDEPNDKESQIETGKDKVRHTLA